MTNSQRLVHIGSGPGAAHARQLKEQKSQSRNEGNIAGRKPRRFWLVRPLVKLPHTPGLSHSLPVDNYYIGVRLDWVLHKHGYWRTTRVGGGSEMGPLALTWDGESYDAGSLKTCVAIEPV
jgi:hypothetical protein